MISVMDSHDLLAVVLTESLVWCNDDVVAPSQGAKPSVRRLAACGALLGALIAFNLWLGMGYDARPRPFLASDIATCVGFAIAGAAAWRLRPRSRIGPTMMLLGAVMLSADPYGFQLSASTPDVD
jgi:hypothetical protein